MLNFPSLIFGLPLFFEVFMGIFEMLCDTKTKKQSCHEKLSKHSNLYSFQFYQYI